MLRITNCVALLIPFVFSIALAAENTQLKEAVETAQQHASQVDIDRVLQQAEAAQSTLTVPENIHAKESAEKARESAELYHSQEFQNRVSCQQSKIKTQQNITAQKPEPTTEELSPTEKLYLFVSSSMPEEEIHTYLEKIALAGGKRILPVMNGFTHGLAEIQESASFFNQVMKEDMRCVDQPTALCPRLPVQIQIDSTLFKRYTITEVPALVYDDSNRSRLVTGNASLEYLLDSLISQSNSKALTSLQTRLRGAH